MDREIKPLLHPKATVYVPGSKSITQRALVIAALAAGKSVLHHALKAEDTRLLMEALRALGVGIEEEGETLSVSGRASSWLVPSGPLYLGNNGTGIRLLTALVALGDGRYVLTGDGRLQERPISPLVCALRELGVEVDATGDKGTPPVTIDAAGIRGGKVKLQDLESSQYISALLVAAPYMAAGIEIFLNGHVPSFPYVAMTIDTMRDFGVDVDDSIPLRLAVPPGQRYVPRSYEIEGDASSASYFFLMAALTGGQIRVANIPGSSRQGDLGILPLLSQLGVTVHTWEGGIEVVGTPLIPGDFTFDLGTMPDMVPTFAVLAAVRSGRTVITGVAHLRYKESDRLHALATELRKVGIRVEERDDGLVIDGGVPHGAEIETYRDHRLAMCFACLGLRVPGIVVRGSECVTKSFPRFWDEVARLGGVSQW